MNSRQSRILVVDDDDDMRAIATEIFNHAGYEVVTAASGHEADQVLASPDFAAAVVDLVLPDTSGLQVLEQVRNAKPDTVLVVITGYASLDSAMEAVRLGAYDYLRKPFTADELLRVVQQGVKERELAEQHRQLLAQLDQANRELLEYRDRLESHLRITSEKLDAFIELGRRLAGSEGAVPSLADVLRAATQVVGASSGAVFTVNSSGFRAIVARGEAGSDLRDLQLTPEEAAFAQTLTSGEPAVITDLLAIHGVHGAGRNDLALLGLGSAIILPLACHGAPAGLMVLFDWQQDDFVEAHMNLLRVLVAHACDLLASGDLQDSTAGATAICDAGSSAASEQFVDLSELLGRGYPDGT